MAESILLINGSPREMGNTDEIFRLLIKGVKSAGNEPIYRKLRELNIVECIGCCKCRELF